MHYFVSVMLVAYQVVFPFSEILRFSNCINDSLFCLHWHNNHTERAAAVSHWPLKDRTSQKVCCWSIDHFIMWMYIYYPNQVSGILEHGKRYIDSLTVLNCFMSIITEFTLIVKNTVSKTFYHFLVLFFVLPLKILSGASNNPG